MTFSLIPSTADILIQDYIDLSTTEKIKATKNESGTESATEIFIPVNQTVNNKSKNARILFSNALYYEKTKYLRESLNKYNFDPKTITLESTSGTVTKPKIVEISPTTSYFANEIPITITATDSISVSEITIETSVDNNIWATATTKVIANPSKTVKETINISVSEIPEGSIYVRAFAKNTL